MALELPARLRWQLLGWYREHGRTEDWRVLLEAIISTGEDTIRLLEERARFAYVTGNVRDAERLLIEREERAPSATASIALGRLYLASGEATRASEISDHLLQSQPGLLTVNQFAADVARAHGDTAAERSHHERCLEERPEHVASLLALARLEIETGRTERAAALVHRAISPEQDRMSSRQLREAAQLLEMAGESDLAAPLMLRADQQDATRTARLFGTISEQLGFDAADVISLNQDSDHGQRPVAVDGTGGTTMQDQAVTEAPVLEPSSEPDLEALHPGSLAKLEEMFGYSSLRPGQASVIANVLEHRDTLATMPTGAGKSLTFQFPAMLIDGATLVISPLIALMKDQVESLPAAVRDRTVIVNSSLSPEAQRQAMDRIASGQAKLVYAAPERLRQHTFLRALHDANVRLLVIDEAHCISLWGHNFRPDYLAIPAVLPALGQPAVLAITATATPEMAEAISASLGRDLKRVHASLFRPNLLYEAYRCANREEKLLQLTAICRKERGAGIVYVGSRRDADAIAALLRDRGVGAVSYHAGLDLEARSRAQERFMSGSARVVVATVAFGMGVDKSDVRFIIHLSPPRSLEAYAQESGRAGRDGNPARCVLLYSTSDKSQLNRLARLDQLSISTLRQVYSALKDSAVGRWAILDPSQLIRSPAQEEDRTDPRIALGILIQAGLIRQHPDAPLFRVVSCTSPKQSKAVPSLDPASRRLQSWLGLDESGASERFETARACQALDCSPEDINALLASQPDLTIKDGPRLTCLELLPTGPDAGQRIAAVLDRSSQAANLRIDQVMRYAAGRACRHQVLAAHLGERLDPCGTACDVCLGTTPGVATRQTASPAAASPSPRSSTTAADAMATLEAVRTLPFRVGKTGLVRLLLGSVESRIRADRSDSFGRLSDVKKSRVEALIDRLIDDGLLYRDLEHEYKLISLTSRGANATIDDLVAYDPATANAASSRSGVIDRKLLDRLVAWRRERAHADDVPPYVVAHNAMLEEIVRVRPASIAELQRINGFGPKRVDLYGESILAALHGSDGQF
jgi:ATP-dependent DNA helicase RecQ